MPSSARLKCKNDPKSHYKGDEPSPKGRGYCAHAEKVGTKKKGTDGGIWTVSTRGEKKQKYWKKPTSKKPTPKNESRKAEKARGVEISKILQEAYWPGQNSDLTHMKEWFRDLSAARKRKVKKLVGPVAKQIEALGITVVVVPSRCDPKNGSYWSDWFWHVVVEDLKAKGKKSNAQYIAIELRLDGTTKAPHLSKLLQDEIWIGFNLRPVMCMKTAEILEKEFGSSFCWNWSTDTRMLVKA